MSNSDLIYKVDKGRVFVLNRFGGQARASIAPAYGGKAVFVDYNPRLERLLITTETGVVGVYDKNGGQIISFRGNGNIVLARWQGDDVFVQNRNGSCELRSQNGGWIRPL
jgi:tricorn protease-like protein